MDYAVTISNTPVEIDPRFLEAASKLAARDRAKVLDFICKFQRDPATPGLQLHQLKDAAYGFWSAKVSRGHRAILCKNGVWTLLHVANHDEAYEWAENRRVERTEEGVLRLIEVVEEPGNPEPSPEPPGSEPGLFEAFEDAYLTSIGVPADWLPTLRTLRTEGQVLEVVDRLPSDLADKLLTLVSGGVLAPPSPLPSWPPPNMMQMSVLEQAREILAHVTELERLGLRAPSGRGRRGPAVGGPVVTTDQLAEGAGVSRSGLLARLQIAKGLTDDAKALLAGTETANATRQLIALARIADPGEQLDVARRMAGLVG